MNQIRGTRAMDRPDHRRGADWRSGSTGRILGLTRSAELRNEADGAGAGEGPKPVRPEEEEIERVMYPSRPRPAPAAYPAPRWAGKCRIEHENIEISSHMFNWCRRSHIYELRVMWVNRQDRF